MTEAGSDSGVNLGLGAIRDRYQGGQMSGQFALVGNEDADIACPLFVKLQIYWQSCGSSKESALVMARDFMRNHWIGKSGFK